VYRNAFGFPMDFKHEGPARNHIWSDALVVAIVENPFEGILEEVR
jgi:hypothetical protein